MNKDKFQVFHFDHHEFYNGNIGNVASLKVVLEGNDGWNFNNIRLRNIDTGDEYIFEYNSWLDGDQPSVPSHVTLSAGTLFDILD